MQPSIRVGVDRRMKQFVSQPDSNVFYYSLTSYLDGLRDANAITSEESSAIQNSIISTLRGAAEKSRNERADFKTLTTL